MAVTSIWPVKSRVDRVLEYAANPEKTSPGSTALLAALHQIDNVAEYAADDIKTEHRALVSGINCQESCAAKQFLETKQMFSKTGGRLCYHAYQSFAAGEVDAETAHKIGVELARRLWGDRFEVLVATHCNTNHYHNHFVLNSVSFVDGMKFDNCRKDYLAMRDMSDTLCAEYGLSVIRNPTGRKKPYPEWQAEQDGMPTRRGMICEDIERAINASTTNRQFVEMLYDMGYQLKLTRANGQPLKYPSIRPPGAKGFFRFHNLGKGYSYGEIMERIYDNQLRLYPFPEAELRSHIPSTFVPYPKATGLRALYLKYCYELHILVRHPTSTKRVPFPLREDITRLEQLDAQSRLLAAHGIDTVEQLDAYTEELKAKLASMPNQNVPAGSALRREVILCNSIRSRSEQLAENLKQLQAEQQIEGKEETEPGQNLNSIAFPDDKTQQSGVR